MMPSQVGLLTRGVWQAWRGSGIAEYRYVLVGNAYDLRLVSRQLRTQLRLHEAQMHRLGSPRLRRAQRAVMSDSVRPGTARDQLLERCARRRLLCVPEPRGGKDDPHRRPRPELALDLELRAVTLHHAIDHGEPQARAPLAFGREEGLETAASDRLRHAHTRVADLDPHLRRGARFAAGAVTDARAQREPAALGHGIDRVQNQVRERVADLALGSHDPGQIGYEIRLQVDDDSPLLRYVAPARAREPRDLLQQIVEIERRQRELRFALTIKHAHARHRLPDIVDGPMNDPERFTGTLAERLVALEQRLGVDRGGRERVVDVVGDATRHLPERPQPLLLHHRLLRLTQVLVRLLQSGVEPHLTRGERQVLAQLTEELAVGARKACRLAPGCDHDAKDLVLDAQGGDHQRTQATTRETCGQGEWRCGNVGLVDELASKTAPKSILIAPDLCVLRQRQLGCQRLTPGAHACDLERLARNLVQGDAAEVDRQVLFEAVNGDPEDAVQILALADRAGDLLEQAEPCELRLELALMSLPLGDVARDLRGADDPAAGILERRDGRGNIDTRSVRADPDGLEVIDTLAAPDARQDFRFLPLPLRREDHQHRPTDRLLRGVSKESLRPGIPRGDDAPEGLADDGVVRGVDDSLEQLLALAKRRFGALALRDVAHECAKADTIPGSDRCDRQLHGEFALVTPEGGDLNSAIEQGTLAGGEIALESLRVLGTVALGNDGLREQPPERLARAPAEQGFGLGAPAGYGPRVIDGDECIQRRIEDAADAP